MSDTDVANAQAATIQRIGNRLGGSPANTAKDLGLLASFVGLWKGYGFNLTARPQFGSPLPFFLELNATSERLEFNAIGGDIPNRGSLQPDIMLHGVRYLQEVTDVVANAGIHIEPGLWTHVPPSTVPPVAENYVRHSTIPHGDAILAQSTFFTTVSGGPLIAPVNSFPFTDAVIPGLNADPQNPITNPDYLAPYLTSPLPDVGILRNLNAAAIIKDPSELLRLAIKGQNIKSTVVIQISTQNQLTPSTIVNIPFVTKNANTTQMDAIFWIETVELPNGEEFLQLQYVQRVILDFINIKWPHISVATLTLF